MHAGLGRPSHEESFLTKPRMGITTRRQPAVEAHRAAELTAVWWCRPLALTVHPQPALWHRAQPQGPPQVDLGPCLSPPPQIPLPKRACPQGPWQGCGGISRRGPRTAGCCGSGCEV